MQDLRLRLILGKYPVTRVEKGLTGLLMEIALPGGMKILCDLPVTADVRLGDLLTLYTEVLADPNRPQPMVPE